MKFIKTCPIIIVTFLITIALLVVSFALEKDVYADYTEDYDAGKAPRFIFVFKGISDGIYPWSNVEEEVVEPYVDMSSHMEYDVYVEDKDDAAEKSGEEDGVNPEVIISGNSEYELVSGNSISGNDADRTYEFTEVDEDYFCDALFIGDSRTVGLSEYCEPLDERATFYAKVSLTIYDVMKKSFVPDGNDKITVDEALSNNQFAKIYIMLGLNEIGTGTPETFAEQYGLVLDRIRELQPDAIIYIQGIMHVTEKKSSRDKYFNNDNINARNEAIAQFADNKTVFYMDMNEAVDDENGNLLAELTFDDVHLKASSYQRWYDFLLGHGIVKD